MDLKMYPLLTLGSQIAGFINSSARTFVEYELEFE
jgi:hypothetical protein